MTTYGEQVRHPSGALGKREEKRGNARLLFILGGLLAVVLVYVFFFRKPGAVTVPGVVANPNGWV